MFLVIYPNGFYNKIVVGKDYELIALGSVNWHAKSGKKEVKNHFQANGTIYNDKKSFINDRKLSRKLRY